MVNQFQNKQSKVSFLSNILMLLTSVHHIYGAVVYHTPARLHILFLSLPVLIATIILTKRQNAIASGKHDTIFIVYALVILIGSILLIGFYEGIYNHIL